MRDTRRSSAGVVAAAVPAIAVMGAVFATACIREPDPFELDSGDVSVHVILEAGQPEVAALITRPVSGPGADVVEDAAVRLIAGSDTTVLRFEADRFCAQAWFDPAFGGLPCYYGAPAQVVEPGRTYELEIILAGGDRVTGSATVPDPVEILEPSAGHVLTVDCGDPDTCYAEYSETPPHFVPVGELEIRWSDPGQERVFLAVRATQAFRDGVAYPAETCNLGFTLGYPGTPGDSVEWRITGIGCTAPLGTARFDSIHAEVVVATAGPEYYRYLEAIDEGQTVRGSSVSVGLDGAWGVFGGVAPARRAFTIVRSPPPAP